MAGTFLSAGLGPRTPTVNFWSELEALPVGPPASGMTRNPETLTLDPEPEILSQVILKGRHLTPPPFVRDGEGEKRRGGGQAGQWAPIRSLP